MDSDDERENDENTPLAEQNPGHRLSPLPALRTPQARPRATYDTALRDITDQFFHPPSPSPARPSVLPRRPRKPRSLAYPADPPNWRYAPSSSSLPPSSPFLPSLDNPRHGHTLATPSAASTRSDPDPFGFVAAECALRAKRAAPALAPRGPIPRLSPCSTVLAPSTRLASFSQPSAPIPTNNEDIEGLYDDEPAAGPSHVVAPLLMMNSDQPIDPRPTSSHPLRTPRKRKCRASSTLDGEDAEESDAPSTPSPVKVSAIRRPARSSHTPAPKFARPQTRAVASAKQPTTPLSRTKRLKTSYQHIPTPSSTPASIRPRSARQSTAPPTPVPPRRSTRQAAVGARVESKDSTMYDREEEGRMKLRPRTARANAEIKMIKTTTRAKHPPSKSKIPKAATTAAKPRRGRPKGKSNAKDTKGSKGKGKTCPLDDVLDMSDGTREKYEKERRDRLDYFKRLEGYQIQKENVYVI